MPQKQKSSKSLPEAQPSVDVPVFLAAPESGLSEAQVTERVAAGLDNRPVEPPRKTAGQIVKENVFTYFNMLFFLLALCVIAVGQWLNLTFMGVVFCNTIIGTIQDLRAQRKLDKLKIMAAAEFDVVRDGTLEQVTEAQLVRDDIVLFDPGCQICADAEVVSGECRVNEALVTGESDEIVKKPGDSLLSGSFVVSGGCRARLTAVGADSFVSKLTIEAKKAGKQPKSEMMRSLTSLIKWIGFLVIPLGVLMFIKEYRWLDRDVVTSVISTVGSIVGMIPEGLYLLTSLALVASIIRLAGRRTLVHDMDCIETLARVDTLCVDKTGTITEPAMIVDDIVPLVPDRFCEDDIRSIMADYVSAMQSDNDTMIALKQYFDGTARRVAQQTLPFSSAKKYGGVQFHSDEVYLLGAPDILLASQPDAADTLRQVEEFSAKGCRVLLLGLYEGGLNDDAPTAPLLPLSLVLLSNKIREAAPDTFAYFARQGVAVKVISGDNALTVSEVARRAGIEGAENYVDARTLQTEKQLAQAAERCTVFGRVTPDQKKQLVQAMDGREIIIRTLDIGADKKADYFDLPPEDNPALGLRAIRLCLTRPALLQTQLCAILRASAFGNVGVMFPMVTGPAELAQLKAALRDAEDTLCARGERFGRYQTGVMIETPAAVFMSRELAREVDFFSIGTNDLTQYLLAMDRQNPALAPFCDPHHPAVLRAIEETVRNAHLEGCRVGICGELAADESLTQTFLRLGVDELSVSPPRILPLRRAIRDMTLA